MKRRIASASSDVRVQRPGVIDRQARVDRGDGTAHLGGERGRIAVRLDDVRHRTPLPEAIRHEDLRRQVLDDAAKPQVADDADDGAGAIRAGLADAQPLANGALPRPQALGQPVVDDHDQVRKALVVGEEPAFEQLDAKRLEQAGRHRTRVGARHPSPARWLCSVDRVREPPVRQIVERQMTDGANARHAGNGGKPITEASITGDNRFCGLVAASGQGEAEREVAIGAKSRVDALHLDEPADQQARADQQHDAQGNLHHEQRPARAVADRRRRQPPCAGGEQLL